MRNRGKANYSRQGELLELFPERNPNPVLRVTLDGVVTYSNPAAGDMLRQLGLPSNEFECLLPVDIEFRLRAVQLSSKGYVRSEYSLGDRHMGCAIHSIDDHQFFHVYLADVTERKQAQEQLFHQTYHDPETGLGNLRLLEKDFSGLAKSALLGVVPIVMLVQIGRVSKIKSSMGHEAVQKILREFTLRLSRYIDQDLPHRSCLLYRKDSDEFALVFPKPDRNLRIDEVANRILNLGRLPYRIDKSELFISLSIGISDMSAKRFDPVERMRTAGLAMREARLQGGSAVRGYSVGMLDNVVRHLSVENALTHALERSELHLEYQPQVDASSAKCIGMEALLRWNSPELGRISPVEFIPLAESSGMIMPIGEWVLRSAASFASTMSKTGATPVMVAVNISARQFHHQHLPQLVKSVLSETQLDPGMLELEITEGIAMQDVQSTIATLKELKSMGVALSIDDFGTGYSSLSYLKEFPIDKLKIDRSFVINLGLDAKDDAIVRAIIYLCHSLGIEVIAEGVETPEQLERLREAGCDQIQGYLFSKPLEPVSLIDWIKSFH